jgi:hypothetical protein
VSDDNAGNEVETPAQEMPAPRKGRSSTAAAPEPVEASFVEIADEVNDPEPVPDIGEEGTVFVMVPPEDPLVTWAIMDADGTVLGTETLTSRVRPVVPVGGSARIVEED